MKINFLNLASVILVAGFAAFVTGCKEDTIIKANVTPASDNIYTDNTIGDTLTILSKTIIDDSISTSFISSSTLSMHGLGTVNDPFFGRTNWTSYFQVVPPSASLQIPGSVDSAVLILPYAGFFWGDSTATSNKSFTVFRVTEDLRDTIVYYSKTYTQVDPTPISVSTTINMNKLADSPKIGGVRVTPHLRIKLKNDFKDLLVQTASASKDNDAFLKEIKGLCVKVTDSTTGSQARYFYINGANDYQRAAVALYYNQDAGKNPDSTKATFLSFVGGDCAHYNHITRNFNGSPAFPYVFRMSGLASDSIMLMQNEPGASLDIRIPYLKNLPKGIINKAQLVITKVSFTNDPDDKFTAPERIYPVGIDPQGGAYTILDRLPVTANAPLVFIDGTRRETILPNGWKVTQYYLNIPREVQDVIVKGADELHLRVNGTVTYPGAYRLIAGGKNNNSFFKVRLNIVYSKPY